MPRFRIRAFALALLVVSPIPSSASPVQASHEAQRSSLAARAAHGVVLTRLQPASGRSREAGSARADVHPGRTAAPRVVSSISDGADGFFVCWLDQRSNYDGIHVWTNSSLPAAYVQHYTVNGTVEPGWPAFGRLVAEVAPEQAQPVLAEDGEGGVIVVWRDYRHGDDDAYAQRIGPSGDLLWNASGVRLGSGPATVGNAAAIADGSGGAYISWEDDYPDGTLDFFLQHLGPTGAPAASWPAGGKPIALGASCCSPLALVPADASSVIAIANGYAQKFSTSGDPQWLPEPGVAVSPVDYAEPGPVAVSDSAGGVLLVEHQLDGLHARRIRTSGVEAWNVTGFSLPVVEFLGGVAADGSGGLLIAMPKYDPSSGTTLFLQRLDSLGVVVTGWQPDSGQAIFEAPGDRTLDALLGDGAGGAFVAWEEWADAFRLQIQHVAGDGQPVWGSTNTAVPLLSSIGTFTNAGIQLVPDGTGGIIAMYPDSLLGFSIGFDLQRGFFPMRGQRLDASGSSIWGAQGVLLRDPAPDAQQWPLTVADGGGGATLVWGHHRGSWNVEATHVDHLGMPAAPTRIVSEGFIDQDRLAAISDGAGGAIVTFFDWQVGQFRVQRFDGAVQPKWGVAGITLSTGLWSPSQYSWLVTDGSGGAVIVWWDGNCCPSGAIHAQRIDQNGNAVWAGGSTVTDAPYFAMTVAPDLAGGAYVGWSSAITDTTAVWVQHLDASGAEQWPAGGVRAGGTRWSVVALTMAPNPGGVLLSWFEQGSSVSFEEGAILVQSLDASGAVHSSWSPFGEEVVATNLWPGFPGLVDDDAGGAYVTWQDRRGPGWRVFGQHVDAAGAANWTAGGLPLSDATGDQHPSGTIKDGAGGAIVAWMDGRGSDWDLYAQRVDGDGIRLWGSTGALVCVAAGQQGSPSLTGDATTGAIVAWQDSRTLPTDRIRVQSLNAVGDMNWVDTGIVSTLAGLVSAEGLEGLARLVWYAGGAGLEATVERRTGGAPWAATATVSADREGRVVYEDRDVTAGQRYHYRLMVGSGAGAISVGETEVLVPLHARFALAGALANPVSGHVAVRFSLASTAPASLEVLDVAGRRLLSRYIAPDNAGARELDLGTLPGQAPGLYLLRLTQQGRSLTARFTLLR